MVKGFLALGGFALDLIKIYEYHKEYSLTESSV